MRRLAVIQVTVYCPHFKRSVSATRNGAISGDLGQLVDCADKDTCRDPAPTDAAGEPGPRPFPHGCPVFPSLAR